jgi:hypothetical protein
METITAITKLEIWHKAYNLNMKDNLEEVPADRAVFGIFGIVNGEPVNCRYTGKSGNLRLTIKELFENPAGVGMKKFMQGPWIQLLQYELMPDASDGELEKTAEEWNRKYKPDIDEEGEYPGYYDY